jgi:hypothetical protein
LLLIVLASIGLVWKGCQIVIDRQKILITDALLCISFLTQFAKKSLVDYFKNVNHTQNLTDTSCNSERKMATDQYVGNLLEPSAQSSVSRRRSSPRRRRAARVNNEVIFILIGVLFI